MQFQRSHWTPAIVRHLIRSGSRCQPTPVGGLRGWDVWAKDGKVLLFKGKRSLQGDWFEFCDWLRKARGLSHEHAND